MQLSPLRTSRPTPPDLARALEAAAAELGHRPAVTLLHPGGREEQSVASLAQWAAKGAHLLELDLLLGPGDELLLDAPAGWGAAAVCLAAWWAGVTVVLPEAAGAHRPLDPDDANDPDDAGDLGRTDDLDEPAAAAPTVAVVHEDRTPPQTSELLRLGDALDGSPLAEVPGEPWASAVQTFPDQPPVPRAAPEAVALRQGARRWTHAEVLAAAGALGAGTYGLRTANAVDDPGADDAGSTAAGTRGADTLTPAQAIAVAARPLVAERPTVILRGVEPAVAAGERITTWADEPS